MRQYFLFELQSFSRNKKNLAVIVLLVIATLYYTLFVAPNYQPNERINERDIQMEHDSMVYWIENREGEGISSGAAFALAYFPTLIEIDAHRLEALEQEDYKAYTNWTSKWYAYEDNWTFGSSHFLSYNPVYYGVNQDYPHEEGSYWYRETAQRYNQYIQSGIEITPNILEERTALQTIYRLLNSSVIAIILIAVVVIYANDIVTKDRKHLSITKSFPLSFSGKLWAKTFVVLTTAAATFLGLFLLVLFIVGMQSGFGSFEIPITVFKRVISEGRGAFETISLGMFFVQALILLSLIVYLFTRMMILFSLLIRNEFFNLLAGIALIFTERLYYMRGIGFFSNVDLLPPTFFPIGQVLSGYQNHLYNSTDITFQNGAISLVVTILLIELILFIATRFKKVRNFI